MAAAIDMAYNDAQIERLNAQVVACDASGGLVDRLLARRDLFTFLVLCYDSVKLTHPHSLQVLINRASDAWDELYRLQSEDMGDATPFVETTFTMVERLLSIHAVMTASAAAPTPSATATTDTI